MTNRWIILLLAFVALVACERRTACVTTIQLKIDANADAIVAFLESKECAQAIVDGGISLVSIRTRYNPNVRVLDIVVTTRKGADVIAGADAAVALLEEHLIEAGIDPKASFKVLGHLQRRP